MAGRGVGAGIEAVGWRGGRYRGVGWTGGGGGSYRGGWLEGGEV